MLAGYDGQNLRNTEGIKLIQSKSQAALPCPSFIIVLFRVGSAVHLL